MDKVIGVFEVVVRPEIEAPGSSLIVSEAIVDAGHEMPLVGVEAAVDVVARRGRMIPVDEGTTKAAGVVTVNLFGPILVRASWSFDVELGGGGGGGGSGGEVGGESSSIPPSSSLVKRSKKLSSNDGSMPSIPRASAAPTKLKSFPNPEARSSDC